MRTEKLTDTMIRDLRAEHGPEDDLVTWHACSVALGDEELCTTADAFEERYGGGGHSEREKAAVLRVTSREEARRLVAVMIYDRRQGVAIATRRNPSFRAKIVDVVA